MKTSIPLWISKNFPLGAPTQTQNTLNQDQIDIKAEHTLKPQVHIFKVIETLCIRYNRNRKKKKKKDNKNNYSSVNGRFRVKTTEVRRAHVHSSLLVVTSNQNASNKKKNRLNIYPKPGMSHYILCLISE